MPRFATQTATGATRTITTGPDGSFVLPNLPIGPYTLDITKDGFAKFVQNGIVLQVDSNPTIDASLKVGAVNDAVTVEADAGMVETHSTGIGTVIDNARRRGTSAQRPRRDAAHFSFWHGHARYGPAVTQLPRDQRFGRRRTG